MYLLLKPNAARVPNMIDPIVAKIKSHLTKKVLGELKKEGFESITLSSLLAKIGTSDPMKVFINTDELIKDFDLSKFSRNTAKFDSNDLYIMNKKSIQFMEFKEAKSRLTEIGLDINEEFWRTISGNLNKLNEARIWWDVVYGEIDPIIDNSNLIEKAIEFFPENNLDNTSWGSWCKSISGNTDYKGRDLFISLRKAITGFEYGPELSNLLPLIGTDKILSRMSGKKS